MLLLLLLTMMKMHVNNVKVWNITQKWLNVINMRVRDVRYGEKQQDCF